MSATDLSEVTALSAVCEQYATGGSEAEVRSRLKEVHDAAVAASKFWNGRAKLLGTRPPRPAEELLVEGVDSETVWQQLQTQSRAIERWARAAEVWLAERGPRLNGHGADDEGSEEKDDHGDDDGEEAADDDAAAEDDDNDEADDAADDDNDEADDAADDEDDEAEDAEDDDQGDEDEDEDDVEGVKEDKFFSMKEMEDFIARNEKDLEAAGEEEKDEEEEKDDEEEVGRDNTSRYKDLFAEDEDDEEEVSERDAAAEARALEAENAKDARDKHWSLRGEVWASDRPEDSLLGSDLTWDVKRKRGAVDADLTAKLEEVIKERIGEGRFDEVASAELQEKALDKPKPAVDDGDLGMAPRAGLAEEYEREYLGVQESKPTRDEAIDALWARLSGKLDALSHFHTAPQKPSLDLEAAAKIADIPAVSLEETTPLAVAATDHRAPEEVHAKKRGKASTLRASDEATTQERRATRAAKKRARNAKRKRLADDAKIVARLNPSRSLLRYDKKEDEPSKNLRPDAELPPSSKKSASTHLFEQLTEEARRVVHGDAAAVVPGDDVRSSTKRRRGAGAAAALKL